MYNEELKKAFLEFAKLDSNSIEEIATVKFNQAEKYEKRFNKDLSNWTINEILTYYKTLCTFSIESLMVLNSLFKRYTYYCINNDMVFDCQNHYEEATNYDLLEECLNTSLEKKLIYTREELLKEIEEFVNPCDKFEVLCLFEGIYDSYQDIFYFKVEDVDEDMNVTLHSGKKVKISKELYQFAMQSKSTYEYVCLKTDSFVVKPFDLSDNAVIKKYVNWRTEDDMYSIRQRLGRRLNKVNHSYGRHYAIKSLLESGRIEELKKCMEEEGVSSDKFIEWWSYKDDNFKKALYERYGTITSIPRWYVKYKKFL